MARNGDNHKGGRRSKAEELGLNKRMAQAFKKVSKGEDADGATRVIEELWKIGLNVDHAKQFDALKWITDRYYGKEPKQIIVEGDIEHNGAESLQNFIKQALNGNTEREVE